MGNGNGREGRDRLVGATGGRAGARREWAGGVGWGLGLFAGGVAGLVL